MTANWCWDDFNNTLESFSFKISQASHYLDYVGCFNPTIVTRSGGIGQTTASETFYVTWCSLDPNGYGNMDDHFWAHVVGGATNLDFAETGVTPG